MKKLAQSLLVLSALFTVPMSSVFAASPDGLGPWADSVVNFSQGLTKGGGAVAAVRSNPSSALGVAENDTVEPHFVSLGFGGSLTLGFDNGISSGVVLVEATNPGYPIEKAKVEVSTNGVSFVQAGTVSQGGSVSIPEGAGCIKYVRVTDTSNPADFSDSTADGYDVDGVQAQGEICQPVTPTPTPGKGGGSGDCKVKVAVTNNATVINTVVTKTNTGKNRQNANTIGGSIVTGDASSSSLVINDVNTTTVNVNQTCGGSASGSNSYTGAGSVNIVNIGGSTKAFKIKK
jgi:hypothetical protein